MSIFHVNGLETSNNLNKEQATLHTNEQQPMHNAIENPKDYQLPPESCIKHEADI
jgi:hypothetical protein